MLEGYFDLDALKGEELSKAKKRLLAVNAAAEIARSSVAASSQHSRSDRVEDSLAGVEKQIKSLADAIQDALEAK